MASSMLLGRNEFGGQTHSKVAASGRLAIIQYGHLAVHEDAVLVATDYTSEVTSTETREYIFEPPTGYDMHSFDIEVVTDGGAEIRLFEVPDTDLTTHGTAITHARLNRGSSIGDTDRVGTYVSPTLASTGNVELLFVTHNGGSTAKNASATPIGGSINGAGEEWVLKSTGNPYMLQVTPNTTIRASLTHRYYEVEQ